MSASVCRTSPARASTWRRAGARPRKSPIAAAMPRRLWRGAPAPLSNPPPHAPARHAGDGHGEEVGAHDVVDEGEVARLLPVAVDLERLAVQRLLEEARDDGRVLRLGVLPRAEDVEVAEAHGFHPVQPGEHLA